MCYMAQKMDELIEASEYQHEHDLKHGIKFAVFENWYRFNDNKIWTRPLFFTKNEVGALAKTHNVKLVDDVAYFGGDVMYKIRLTPDNEDELIDIIYPEI